MSGKKEPLERDALSEMDTVIITLHIGAFTEEGQNRVVGMWPQCCSGKEAKNFFNFSRSEK